MKRSLVLALCLFGAFPRVAAQPPNQSASTASISGVVTKEPGSRTVEKATIQIIAEDQGKGSNYTATTDSSGSFSVEKIEAGQYRLSIEKAGFVEINTRGRKSESRLLSVREGEQLKDLLFRMLPTAVIAGRIVDEDGAPMSGVLVFAQKKKPGKAPRLETAGTERTNDLGEYRFHGLSPGQYLVVAMPPPDFHDYERQREKTPEEASKPDIRYLTTYYPGTYDSAQASTITLRSGDEMPVNLTLIPGRTYRVRGIVTGIPVGQKALVELTSKMSQALLRAIDVGPDGLFEVRGVAPGSYIAKATVSTEARTLTARQYISVVAADVDGIKLVPRPSFTVSGHVSLGSRPTGAITQYTVNLHSVDAPDDTSFFISTDSFAANAPVDRFGDFQWTNVFPGTYFVQLYGGEDRDSFLKSVTLGDQNMDAGFNVTGPATVELVVSLKGGTVDGVILDHDQPVANGTVVVVPEEKFRKIPSRFGVATSDQNGHFTIRGLAPGSYTAFAWQDIANDLYYDPDFLKSQESNATTLKVEEGSRQKMELKLSPISDEWQ